MHHTLCNRDFFLQIFVKYLRLFLMHLALYCDELETNTITVGQQQQNCQTHKIVNTMSCGNINFSQPPLLSGVLKTVIN